jgi:hypothetical protein
MLLVSLPKKTRRDKRKDHLLVRAHFWGFAIVMRFRNTKKTIQKDERIRFQARACEPETTAQMPKP